MQHIVRHSVLRYFHRLGISRTTARVPVSDTSSDANGRSPYVQLARLRRGRMVNRARRGSRTQGLLALIVVGQETGQEKDRGTLDPLQLARLVIDGREQLVDACETVRLHRSFERGRDGDVKRGPPFLIAVCNQSCDRL